MCSIIDERMQLGMENTLNKAKHHQKRKEWDDAIFYYDKIITDSTNKVQDNIYVDYAKCLKAVGKTNQAEKVLIEAKSIHTNRYKILEELYSIYDSLEEWDEALIVAKELIKQNSKKAENYFLLGRAYAVLKDKENASNNYKKGLEHKHNMKMEKLIKKIQLGFADNPSEVTTDYTSIDGFNNYGAFIHQYKGKKYFTKISRSTAGAKREDVFYNFICEEFPVLKEIVPLYIDSQFIDNILYLTLEMIESTPISSEHTQDIIKTTQTLSSISYDALVRQYPNPNYSFLMRNKPTAVGIFSTKIHEAAYNKRMFSLLYKLMQQKKYPIPVKDVIQKIESMIMDNHMYLFIKPKKHYSLVHRDFTKRNIKIKKQDNTVKVFDWAGFSIGPHFITIARYLTASLTPYSEVKNIYLDNNNINGNLSKIEKIFFLYILILFYILRLKEKRVEEGLDKYILPALDDMEMLVTEFMKNDFEEEAKNLLLEKVENENKLKTENNTKQEKIKRLNRKIKKLEKRHADMINSKSWKITKPLRLLKK